MRKYSKGWRNEAAGGLSTSWRQWTQTIESISFTRLLKMHVRDKIHPVVRRPRFKLKHNPCGNESTVEGQEWFSGFRWAELRLLVLRRNNLAILVSELVWAARKEQFLSRTFAKRSTLPFPKRIARFPSPDAAQCFHAPISVLNL